MNLVGLVGNLTADPDVRYTGDNLCIAKFTVAINRIKEGADFPRIIVFGKQAENCEKYIGKGSKVAITGRIQTGSYDDKEGKKVYTTEVVAERVEFLSWKESEEVGRSRKESEEVGRSRKESEEVGRNRKKSEEVGRSRKESEEYSAIDESEDLPF